MPVIHDTNHSYIVLELCDYNLDEWLKREEVKDLTEEDWRMKSVHLIGDLLRGLEHMHAKDMLHRDLKVGLTCVHVLTFSSQHCLCHCITSHVGKQPLTILKLNDDYLWWKPYKSTA